MSQPRSSRGRILGSGGAVHAVAPEFLVPSRMLDVISPSGDSGVVLGSDPYDQPVTVQLMRAEPTRIVVVGGLYLARQVALRTLATGAAIVVATGRPAAWRMITEAVGAGDRSSTLVQIHRLAPLELPRASDETPLLVLQDGGAAPQELFGQPGPWQTILYVLPYLHPQAAPTATTADLVLLQRLLSAQAQLAAQLWRLSGRMSRELAALDEDRMIALGPNLWQPVRLVTTPQEQAILGPIRRGD